MNKLQCQLIDYLEKHGNIKFLLPDNMILEIGINQIDNNGDLKKTENYCWVIVKSGKNNRSVSIDSYNLGFKFPAEENNVVFDEEIIDENGIKLKVYEVS